MIALLVGAALAAKAVVWVDDVGACEVVGAERVALVEWPTALGAPPIAELAAVVGKVAREPLFAGEAARAERLSADAKSAGCGGAGAARVAVPVRSAIFEPGVTVSWWAPRLGCALFSGPIVAGVDAASTVGIGVTPPGAALAAFSTNRSFPVVTPRGTSPLPVCAWGPTLPVGPWSALGGPGIRLQGAVGDGPWGKGDVVNVPIGVGGLGGVVTATEGANVRAWPVGVEDAPLDEPIVLAPGVAAVVSDHAILAGTRDRSIAEVVVMPDGHAVVVGLSTGKTRVLLVSAVGPVVRTIEVSGPAVVPRTLTDRWRNLMEGEAPVVYRLSGGPFETQLDHGWVQVRALAPGRGLVVFYNRSGQVRVVLVSREI